MFRQCYAIDYLTNETVHSRIESRSICALKKKINKINSDINSDITVVRR